MPNETHSPAHDPQDLERLLVARQRTGDVAGMMAPVVDCDEGRLLQGKEAIRAHFAGVVAAAPLAPTEAVWDVGGRRQLFIDRRFVADASNVELIQFQ